MPIYMKYEGVPGTAGGNRKDWIELESCQFGGSGFGRGTSVSEIVVSKFQDNSSTHLFREALNGEGKKVTIDFTKTDGTVYMTIELEGTLISNYSISGHGGDSKEKPMETLTLNYIKITYVVKAADAKSAPDRAVWDLAPKQGS